MLALAFIAVPVLTYLLPAILPIWKPFLLLWSVLAALLVLSWFAPILSETPQDALARQIDNALRAILAICWLTAGIVQGIRGFARSRNYTGYRHWPVVGLFGLGLAGTGLAFL